MLHARKTASLLWPSRPASPAPPSTELPNVLGTETPHYPPLAPRITPKPVTESMSNDIKNGTGLPAADSYCTVFGLQLSEAVSKAIAGGPDGPVVEGRRPIPAGRGKALGNMIARDFTSASPLSADAFTQRAILRTVLRPLSVLLTSLHALVGPLLASPLFLPTLPLPVTPTPPQLHALAIAVFARELSAALAIPDAPRFVTDGLAGPRAQLDALEARICTPLLTSLKTLLSTLADGLSAPAPHGTKEHPALLALHHSLTGAGKLLAKLMSTDSGEKEQGWVVSVLITFVWRGIVALASRPHRAAGHGSPERRASPPPGYNKEDRSKSREREKSKERGSPPPLITPTVTSRFALKQLVSSRPATPGLPMRPSTPTPLTRDTFAFQSLTNMLTSTLPPINTALPSEVLSEALQSLSQLPALFSIPGATPPLPGSLALPQLDTLPSTLVLTYLLPRGIIPGLLGMDEAKFRAECLGGWRKAEEWEGAVERAVGKWVEGEEEWRVLGQWLAESD